MPNGIPHVLFMSMGRIYWYAICMALGGGLGFWWGLEQHVLVAITFMFVGIGLGAATAYNPFELALSAIRMVGHLLKGGV
ncbi:MAG: hypothetical protein RIB57_01160 [Pelagibacterium sp.]|uniref:hypothetical protein n=1 Tax=Pelagibacterium sp. TaxID=1967288 RepID=UPI0032EECFED